MTQLTITVCRFSSTSRDDLWPKLRCYPNCDVTAVSYTVIQRWQWVVGRMVQPYSMGHGSWWVRSSSMTHQISGLRCSYLAYEISSLRSLTNICSTIIVGMYRFSTVIMTPLLFKVGWHFYIFEQYSILFSEVSTYLNGFETIIILYTGFLFPWLIFGWLIAISAVTVFLLSFFVCSSHLD